MPESAAPFVPTRPTLRTARQAAATCTGCDLYRYATQTVFGEGRADAAVMFVGEQPGDAEDIAGKPFVGPELALVKPRALVCLGATAAQALLGSTFKVSTERGKFVESPLAPLVMATVHPSSVLRAQTGDERHRAMEELVADLRTLAKRLSR